MTVSAIAPVENDIISGASKADKGDDDGKCIMRLSRPTNGLNASNDYK